MCFIGRRIHSRFVFGRVGWCTTRTFELIFKSIKIYDTSCKLIQYGVLHSQQVNQIPFFTEGLQQCYFARVQKSLQNNELFGQLGIINQFSICENLTLSVLLKIQQCQERIFRFFQTTSRKFRKGFPFLYSQFPNHLKIDLIISKNKKDYSKDMFVFISLCQLFLKAIHKLRFYFKERMTFIRKSDRRIFSLISTIDYTIVRFIQMIQVILFGYIFLVSNVDFYANKLFCGVWCVEQF
eukprot:TRINITY_DN15434_c0_g1_i12.p1 TRINITY_DN15434_c0_g1~~TRINITY_DN15434_c0_g1_i12.p1  ORF type:complete len:238 (+),score=-7.94 TRINITY_DN15434_c0_g1_i12:525-1238(+)